MILIAMMLQAATPAPSAEATRLGVELARSGTFSRIAPLIAEQQADELAREMQDLTDTERTQLREIAKATAASGIERATGLMGKAYAQALSIADMRAIIAFNRTPAAARYRAAEPMAIAAAAEAVKGLDLKRDVLTAFCAKTGKGCRQAK